MTTDLAALAFHKPYTTSNILLLVMIQVYLLLILAPSPLPLYLLHYYLTMCYMCLPCLKTSSRFLPFVSITLLISFFLTLYFRCRIVTWGPLWFVGSVEMVFITGRSLSRFSLLLWFCPIQFSPRFLLSPCDIVVLVICLCPIFANFLVF